jgi:hypothetical protein
VRIAFHSSPILPYASAIADFGDQSPYYYGWAGKLLMAGAKAPD